MQVRDYGTRFAFVPFSLRCHGRPSKEIISVENDGDISPILF